MTQTPRIYLDVDGVLNAVSSRAPSPEECGWSQDSWRRERINGYMISWSTELVDALNELVADGVEIRWLTTWCELAQQLIAPALGLKGGDSWKLANGVTADEARMWDMGRRWWKTGVFEADHANDPADKIVWIDDDHRPDVRTTVMNDLLSEDRLFIIAPFTDVGITRRDIDQIRDFLFNEDVQEASA
jgi:hypothetical protein